MILGHTEKTGRPRCTGTGVRLELIFVKRTMRKSPEYLMIANVYFLTHKSFKKILTIKGIEKCDFRFFRVVITITVFWDAQC